jgi:tetratricopeptide (TPR) repeat protein
MSSNRRHPLLGLLAAVVVLLAPTMAHAASKVVEAMITAAQKELAAGNFDRAGELFLDIWRQDPEQKLAFYNAGRAYQMAGKVDRADELFRELIATPNMDPALKAKAQSQLDALVLKRSERKADEADRAEKSGQYAVAAALWGEAFQLQNSKLGWLLRQGRALHLAGQPAAALTAYDRYLSAAPAGSPERAQAEAWRLEVMPKPVESAPAEPPKPVTEAPKAEAKFEPPAPAVEAPVVLQPAPVVVPQVTSGPAMVSTAPPMAPAAPPSRLVPMVVLGTGGALALTGVIVLAVASGDQATLESHIGEDGNVRGISEKAYEDQASKIEGRYMLGWALTGVGVVGAGAGAWLWSRQPTEAAVKLLPTPGGVLLSARF